MRSVKYAVDMNLPITNSWGGPYSASLHSEIARSLELGSVFVAAAGNNNRNRIAKLSNGLRLGKHCVGWFFDSGDGRSWFSTWADDGRPFCTR